MAPKKKYATDEERKAAKNASKKAYYDRHKGDPAFMKKFNVLNLKRYHEKRQDPEFLESLNEKRREYYHACKDRPGVREKRSVNYRRNAENRMWDGITRGALKRAVARSIPYDTDLLEWATSAWTGKCALSGVEFRRGMGTGPSPFSPSIDRIIPSLGYTKGNCRFILHALNALKGAGTDEDALAIAKAFVEFSQRDQS